MATVVYPSRAVRVDPSRTERVRTREAERRASRMVKRATPAPVDFDALASELHAAPVGGAL